VKILKAESIFIYGNSTLVSLMTKEEKEAKKEEEGKVPEGFAEAVNEFYESADIIFKCFDEIYSDYLRGKDVREDLKEFRNKKARIFDLINDIFHREEQVKKSLDKANIEEEKKDKIVKFTQRYSDLSDDIKVVYLETSFGWINPPSNFEVSHSFDPKTNTLLIELELHSGSNIFRTKTLAIVTYILTRILQSAVLKCIEESKDKNIAVETSGFKGQANGIKKDAEKILGMLEEIEKKEKEK